MDRIDAGARAVGSVYIWYKMFVALVVAILFGVISALVAFRVRPGWTSSKKKVEARECTPTTVEECETTRKGKRDCKRRSAHNCKLTLDGPDNLSIHKVYKDAPPQKGDTVVVYYDPDDERGTATLQSFPKTAVVGITALVAIGNLVWLIFLWHVKDNETAQRIGAGALVVDAFDGDL